MSKTESFASEFLQEIGVGSPDLGKEFAWMGRIYRIGKMTRDYMYPCMELQPVSDPAAKEVEADRLNPPSHLEYAEEDGWNIEPEGNMPLKSYPPDPNTQEADMVNRPPHYTRGEVEVIDIIESSLTTEESYGYYCGVIIKYLLRWKYKGGLEDLKKARWYLNRWIDNIESRQS